ncbi:MAG: glycosyltransferase [Planctomycetaceae bacterium]|nr:glycosyltransferase [Planctomycetaceae bacterium]
MRIVHLSTNESAGGAARAAHGLHASLVAEGADSRMLVLERQSDDGRVAVAEVGDAERRAWAVVEERWIARERTKVSNTLFSTGAPGACPARHPFVREADVINLHWVPRLASARDIGDLLALGKPVVWTLHDEWAYTGGCHYASGCGRWRTACMACPQLARDPHGLVEAVFASKRLAYARGALTVVAPSRWLARRAGESALLAGCRVECIPYGVDLATFDPVLREEGRARLGVVADDILVLFSADAAAERRKGFAELTRALDVAAGILPATVAARLRFVVLGETAGIAMRPGSIAPGRVMDRRTLASIVAASDLFVLPSLEDNLPNGILEALACGTPCVAFDAGGAPDMLANSPGSELAPVGDVHALGASIARAIGNVGLLRPLRGGIRADAEQRYAPRLQARGYLALYDELLAARSETTPAGHAAP